MNLQVNWNESVCTGVILKSVTDIQKVISDAQSFRFNQWELSIPASGQSEAGILFVDVTDDRSLLRPWLHQLGWTRVGRVTCQDNFHQIFHDYNSNSWNALDKDWFSKLLKREKISKHKLPWAAAVNKLTANIKKDWIIYILLGKEVYSQIIQVYIQITIVETLWCKSSFMLITPQTATGIPCSCWNSSKW